MGGISKWVEDGCNFIWNGIWHVEGVECGKAEVFGKASIAVNANDFGVDAVVAISCAAVAAVAAENVAFAGDPVANFKAGDAASEFCDFADEFVPDGCADGDVFLGPIAPFVDVNVSSADSCFLDFDEDLMIANCGDWHLSHP